MSHPGAEVGRLHRARTAPGGDRPLSCQPATEQGGVPVAGIVAAQHVPTEDADQLTSVDELLQGVIDGVVVRGGG